MNFLVQQHKIPQWSETNSKVKCKDPAIWYFTILKYTPSSYNDNDQIWGNEFGQELLAL